MGSFGFSSGPFPAPRTAMNLLRKSNQKGAPSEAAKAVRRRPTSFVVRGHAPARPEINVQDGGKHQGDGEKDPFCSPYVPDSHAVHRVAEPDLDQVIEILHCGDAGRHIGPGLLD